MHHTDKYSQQSSIISKSILSNLDLDLLKSKISPLASTMVGPGVATKPWNFYSPELLLLLP